jgi:ubiquinone/menaquinone biosynthesis C-methylase UbiE
VAKYLNKSQEILDLGCGTGLCGAWFTDYSARLVGVDLSPKMIEVAKKKVRGPIVMLCNWHKCRSRRDPGRLLSCDPKALDYPP